MPRVDGHREANQDSGLMDHNGGVCERHEASVVLPNRGLLDVRRNIEIGIRAGKILDATRIVRSTT